MTAPPQSWQAAAQCHARPGSGGGHGYGEWTANLMITDPSWQPHYWAEASIDHNSSPKLGHIHSNLNLPCRPRAGGAGAVTLAAWPGTASARGRSIPSPGSDSDSGEGPTVTARGTASYYWQGSRQLSRGLRVLIRKLRARRLRLGP